MAGIPILDNSTYSYYNARLQAMRMLNSKLITRTEYNHYMRLLSGAEFNRQENILYRGDYIL